MTNTLYRWIHISDIHMGHGDAMYAWDQRLVLDELKRDIARQLKAQPDPPVDAIFVTGDIANTGAGKQASEYTEAMAWLLDVAIAAGVSAEQIFVVPGNHDVDRGADADASVKELVNMLRDGTKELDDALSDSMNLSLLAKRMDNYLAFARNFAPKNAGNCLFWMHRCVARSGLRIRVVGLNTALLAASDDDQGKLRLGMTQLGKAFRDIDEEELVLGLGHHPLGGAWLADEAEIEPYIKRHMHVLMTGHVHQADVEELRGGFGDTFVRIVAGSSHGDRVPKGIPAGHGYSFGAVIRAANGKGKLRITPRKWSTKNATFRPDVDNVPEGQTFSEHTLPLTIAQHEVTKLAKTSANQRALRIAPNEPVAIFISVAPEDMELCNAPLKHLSMLRRSKKAVFKHSQEVTIGVERKNWISERLNEAELILLLISKDYIASDDYYEDELLHAIERHDRGEARVVPILMRKYSVSDEPFAKLQPLPRNGHSVVQFPTGQDDALTGIARELSMVIAQMRGEAIPSQGD